MKAAASKAKWMPPPAIQVRVEGLMREVAADALLDKAISYEEQERRLARKTTTSGIYLRRAANLRELSRIVRDGDT